MNKLKIAHKLYNITHKLTGLVHKLKTNKIKLKMDNNKNNLKIRIICIKFFIFSSKGELDERIEDLDRLL